MTSAGKKLFCFGYGYSCDYLGASLMDEGGWRVAGTTRDPDKRTAMRERGVDAFLFDYEYPIEDAPPLLHDVTHLLISTPPGDAGDPAFLIHEPDITRLQALEWIGYLSSTGVYGDRGGDWVDESAEIRPDTKRGSRRARAEAQWLSLYEQHGLPVHIFRLAGIYGPGRSAIDSVRTGMARRIDKPGHAFSRIHVADIAQVLRASMAAPDPGAVYNVCDDLPAQSHEVIDYACELLGREPPPLIPFEDADMAPMARSFYRDNKRVCNDKMKHDLGVKLLYPDYKAGLRSCLDAERPAGQQAVSETT